MSEDYGGPSGYNDSIGGGYDSGGISNIAEVNKNDSSSPWANDISHAHNTPNYSYENHVPLSSPDTQVFPTCDDRMKDYSLEDVNLEGLQDSCLKTLGDGGNEGGDWNELCDGGNGGPHFNNTEESPSTSERDGRETGQDHVDNDCSQGCLYCAVLCYECTIL